MKFEEIPDYDTISTWKNAYGEIEAILEDEIRITESETLLHLVEDTEADHTETKDETFYITSDGQSLYWIREHASIPMNRDIVDTDYVSFFENGRKKETQHNHIHLDRDVQRGKLVPMKVVETDGSA